MLDQLVRIRPRRFQAAGTARLSRAVRLHVLVPALLMNLCVLDTASLLHGLTA